MNDCTENDSDLHSEVFESGAVWTYLLPYFYTYLQGRWAWFDNLTEGLISCVRLHN